MNYRQTPDWLYNALPYVYVAAGLFTIAELPNEIGVLSGVMLMSAGIIVWGLRRKHRLSWRLDTARQQPGTENAADRFVQISWRSSFECGDPVIDAQHSHLFDLGNEFINAGVAHKSKPEMARLMAELIQQISRHFHAEEQMLSRSGYPLSEQHREEHRALLSKAMHLSDRFRRGKIVFGEIVGFVVYDLVVNHVVKDGLFEPTPV